MIYNMCMHTYTHTVHYGHCAYNDTTVQRPNTSKDQRPKAQMALLIYACTHTYTPYTQVVA